MVAETAKEDRITSLVFAQAVRELGILARRGGYVMPGYRGSVNDPHKVDRQPNGRVTVTINLDQPEWRALLDMFDGLLEAQTCPHTTTFEVLDEGRANDAGISHRHQCAHCGLVV